MILITIESLAENLIESMNWDNDHLHSFWFPEIRGKAVFSHWYTPYSIGSDGYDNDQYPLLSDFE